jgi:hypothetical protein
LKDDCDNGGKKQQVDEPRGDVKGDEAHYPQDQKHHGDCEKHDVILVPVRDGSDAPGSTSEMAEEHQTCRRLSVRKREALVDPATVLVCPAFLLGAVRPTPFVATPRPANLDVVVATNFDVSTLDVRAGDRGLPVTAGGAGP